MAFARPSVAWPTRATVQFGATIILLLFLGLYPKAQGLNLRHYSLDAGLPQSQIRDLLQDSRGYLWVATLGGLARFDGQTFTTFGQTSAHLTYAVCEDRLGVLWFGTSKGLSRYDGQTFTTFTAADGLGDNMVRALYGSRSGTIWIGTDGGVVQYDGKSFSPLAPDVLNGIFVLSLFEDSLGRLWIGTQGEGLYLYDGGDTKHFDENDGLAGRLVWSIAADASGKIWVGTKDGLSRFDDPRFSTYTEADGLPGREIFDIHQGDGGHLWLGTANGIAYYDGSRFSSRTNRPIGDQPVNSIAMDREGNLWFGTDGDGLYLYAQSPFVNYDASDGLASEYVFNFAQESSGAIWLTTRRSGVSRLDGERFSALSYADRRFGEEARALLVDRSDDVWVGSYGGISRYDGQRFVPVEAPPELQRVRVMIEDRASRLWVGTSGDGLFRRDADGWKQFTQRDGLSSNRVLALLEDRRGVLWVSTIRGVDLYDGHSFTPLSPRAATPAAILGMVEDPQEGLWLATYGSGVTYIRLTPQGTIASADSFQVDQGLSDNAVPALVFDDGGDLWACTNKGLSRIDVAGYKVDGQKRIRRYGRAEGFVGIECNTHAAIQGPKGTLWFGTIKGATRYDPAFDRANMVEPRTYVTGMRLFLQKTDWETMAERLAPWTGLPQHLTLPHDRNHLTFSFTALSFRAPEGVRYQCKLDGFDKDWSPVIEERQATYSNLPPGRYTFLVKAANSDGVWNAVPEAYAFAIAPAFWQTRWFQALCVLVGGIGVMGIVHLRTRALRGQRLLLESTVALRTQELQASNSRLSKREESLRRLRREIELILQSVAEGLCGTDGEGRVVFANPAFARLIGYRLTEVLGRPLLQLLGCPEESDASLASKLGSILGKGTSQPMFGEATFIRKDQSGLPAEYALTAIVEDACVTGAVLTFRDVTDKRQLQARLLQSRKLEAIGQLAAGIAHEINTPIQFIADNNRFLQDAFGDILDILPPLLRWIETGEARFLEEIRSAGGKADLAFLCQEIPDAIGQSRDGLERVAAIVKATKEFAHTGGSKDFADVNQAIRSTITVAGSEWKYVADVETDLDDDLPLVPCQANEIKQAMLNIIINAAQSIAETVGEAAGDKGLISIETKTDGPWAEIRISDTGAGIPDEIRDRVFDPFFTTKVVGKGSGQGLAIAYNIIVDKHEGEISVQSRPGHGSIFTIRLPLQSGGPSRELQTALAQSA